MKNVAYAVAGLAAIGIMVALIFAPSSSDTAPASATPATLVSATPMTEAGEVTLEVPGMHCQFSCYPNVKESLDGVDSVAEVKLVDQPDPNSLTVKRVVVRYDEGFNLKSAIDKLEAKGYAATVVQ